MDKTSATIILDSIIDGVRITTFELVFPRIILPEFNTHRVFSRNTSSSRAIPFKKMVKENTGFKPQVWRLNGKGMSPKRNAGKIRSFILNIVWSIFKGISICMAGILYLLDVHKEITNRLLEPFMYSKVVMTTTEFDNFFMQRCHSSAQYEIRKLANLMRIAYKDSKPEKRSIHLPYSSFLNVCRSSLAFISSKNKTNVAELLRDRIIKSVASCARVSYTNHGKESDLKKDEDIFNKLSGSNPKHLSPFEHIVLNKEVYKLLSEYFLWKKLDKSKTYNNLGTVIQFRKIVENNDTIFKSGSSK